jgi:TonB-dependent receptor
MLRFLLPALALLTPLRAQPAAPGVIEGRIVQAATGGALGNVRVSLEGSAREVLTDDAGAYRLTGVAAGPVRLRASYVGFATAVEAVTVPAGGVASRDFELVRGEGVVRLDRVTVVEDREMSAQALSANEQRAAPNLKSVVAIDEFGDRGAENIGEFLLFLPGVSIETSGSEPITASLRGFPGNNTGLTIDGGEVAGAFSGNSRSLDLREVPMNNISRVEITKVPTPDLPASGLGGSINLISRSGFEARRPRLEVNAYTMFHDRGGFTFDPGPRNHTPRSSRTGTSPSFIQPSFDVSYLHPVSRNLAVTVGASRTWRHKPMETGTADTDESATWDLVRLVQTTSQWNSLAQTFSTLQGQAGLDWRVGRHGTLSASTQYRSYQLYLTRNVLQFNYGAGATGTDRFMQGATTGVGNAGMNNSGTNVDIRSVTRHHTLRYRHRGDPWRIDAAASYSSSGTYRPDIESGTFNMAPATLSNLVLRGDDLQTSGGIIPTRYSARNRAGQTVDLLDGANYSLASGNTATSDATTTRQNLRLDVGRELDPGFPLTLRAGAALDASRRDQRSFPRLWNFRPEGAADEAARRAGRFDVFDEAFLAEAPNLFGQPVRWISPQKFHQLFLRQPGWFVEDLPTTHQNYVSNSREFRETVTAAYLRADLRLLRQRLWLVGGVRFERTDARGSGPLNDPNAQYQRNRDGSFVRNAAGQRVLVPGDALALRRLRYVERGARAERSYDGLYPSLNAAFTLREDLILRAAYARTLGRPNVNLIVPGTTISEPDAASPTISVNNPGLMPWTADSYDLTLESYQLKGGVGSVGVFRKDIRNFFGLVRTDATPALLESYGLDSDPALLGYELSTRANVGDARITGFELSYRQSLTFLPAWARGLQVFVNATKLSLSGSNTSDFTGYNPESLAGGINLVRPRFSLKATLSYLGDTQRGLVAPSATVPVGTYNYQARRTRVGLSAQYSLSRRYSLYASVVDLGGFVQNQQRYAPSTPAYARGQRWQELGYYTNVGVRGSF